VTLVGWLVALLVESVGTVSFTGPPVSGAFFALVGVVTAILAGPEGYNNGGSEVPAGRQDTPPPGQRAHQV
jgi:hypothetical protein